MNTRSIATWVLLLLATFPLSLAAEDLWLAVGYGGRRMISTDGIRWEITGEWAQPGGDDSNNLMSAVYAEGKFVVVGGGGGGSTGGGHILVSSDGKEWTETKQDKSRINPVVHGGGRFVVGTSSYPSGKLMWSDDAETWHEGASIQAKGLTHFRHGCFGNGIMVLVGNGSQKQEDGTQKPIHWAITTTDGETIKSERVDLAAHGEIVFGKGRFVMLSHEGVVQSTADGAEWKLHDDLSREKFRSIVWTGSEFLLVRGDAALKSSDAITWEAAPIKSFSDIKWSDGKRFIASGWPGKMLFSSDGTTWEKAPPMTDNGINVVVHASK